MDLIFGAFWFFLPAGIANMSPVLINKLPWINKWNTPIDLGHSWRGKRILGDNKRFRGLVFGGLTAGIVASLLGATSVTNGTFYSGCLMGLGALTGDSIESIFKRQKNVKPGEAWFPFDQIDYIIGGLIFAYPLLRPSLAMMAVILIMFFGLHLLTSYIGYLLGLKSKPI